MSGPETPDRVIGTLDHAGLLLTLTGTGTVATAGFASKNDTGAGKTIPWRVSRATPTGWDWLTAVKTSDGAWATMTAPPVVLPDTTVPEAAREEILARCRTFVRPPADLVWDASRKSPVSVPPVVVKDTYTRPYPITCSQFLAMAARGMAWETTTYVADQNSRVPGAWVARGADSWTLQAAYTMRSMWNQSVIAKADWERTSKRDYSSLRFGDILFFAHQDPEGSWAKLNGGGLNFFPGNIYHVALYIGDGRVMHSTHPTSPTAVYEASLDSLAPELAWVGRPIWEVQ